MCCAQLTGEPLTALWKNQDKSSKPIAISKILQCLINDVCCAVVKLKLPDILLPFQQLGVAAPRSGTGTL
jgi:hypothetical protein